MNPFRTLNQFNQITQQARMLQNNPAQIGRILFDRGRIGQEHYDAIKDMKSPSQIGEYLMNKGVLDQSTVNQLAGMIR